MGSAVYYAVTAPVKKLNIRLGASLANEALESRKGEAYHGTGE